MSASIANLGFGPGCYVESCQPMASSSGATDVSTHAEFDVKLNFKNITNDPAAARLRLVGPGEILGIDPHAIIRTYPARDAYGVETSFFPLIEFDQPDFPWRYTPSPPMEHDRLMPWLVLIVLADDEFDPKEVVHSYGRLPSIKVAGKYLPNLDDSWAWAHTQIAASGEAYGGSDEEVKSNVTKVVTNEPHRDRRARRVRASL